MKHNSKRALLFAAFNNIVFMYLVLPPFPMLPFEKKNHQNVLCSLKIWDATKYVQGDSKKWNQHWNSYGLHCLFWCNYTSADFTFFFSFFVSPCTDFCCISNFTWTLNFASRIHSYFCYNFRTHLDVVFFKWEHRSMVKRWEYWIRSRWLGAKSTTKN